MSGTELALWLAVVASGLWHGLSPGMGWPLAVSAGLMEGRGRAVLTALGPLALGHFAAISLALAPFAILATLADWRSEIQAGAGIVVVAFGVWRLVDRRHPRILARVPASRLALWSFLIALAHGAGLLLAPIYLGLCSAGVMGPGGAALTAALVHTAAMFAAGGAVAWLVYARLGLGALKRGWLNLETLWAGSLIVAGGAGLISAAA